MKHSRNLAQIALLSVLLVLIAGCGQVSQQQPAQEISIEAASIVADCVVNYFQKDGVPYITQQRHRFNPETGYLEIIATEPSGLYQFTLNKDNFSSSNQLTPFLSGLPASFVNQPLATALFYSFTTGAGLLETGSAATTEPIKIEGLWYESMLMQKGNIELKLLNNKSTNRIDLVEISQYEEGFTPEKDVEYYDMPLESMWLVKSYNLRYSKELETLVPMKINIFDIRNGLASKQLIIQVDYKSILKQ